MTTFKKILIALDDKTELDESVEKTINKIVDDFTTVKITDEYSVYLNNFKSLLDELKSISKNDSDLSDKIYTIVEKHFDNYSDEIHDMVIKEFTNERDSWTDNIIIPTIFIRDHKQDNKFRNRFSLLFLRIIQFLINEKNIKNPGEERTGKIVKMGVDKIILFTNSNEDNQFGIQYIGYISEKHGIPCTTIYDGVEKGVIFEKPTLKEELQIFKRMDMESDEYKAKFRDSVKMLRKSYYDSIKSKPEMKIVDLQEKKAVKIKAKVPSKAMKKKALKKKNDIVNRISEVEILEESYD